MSKKGKFNGKKLRGRHTKVNPLAEKLISAADRMTDVTGIQPSQIINARTSVPRAKFVTVPVGLKISALSGGSKQTVIVHTTCPDKVETRLRAII